MCAEEQDMKLLPFLRDVCGLTSVKDGCSEGACGTCHVLIDGKATKACVPKLSKLEGKHIMTVEGLPEEEKEIFVRAFGEAGAVQCGFCIPGMVISAKLSKLEGKHIMTVEGLPEEEKEIFVRAFGEAGAVQCGFCIPGMVISAKALIDKNPNPGRAEAADAIKNNICRCTGYKKIIDGILLAAKYKREGLPKEKEYTWKLGERVPRVDVREKVLGYGEYPDDIHMEGMIYGSALEGLPKEKEYTWKLGERVPRVDVREKVLGYGEYPDDIHMEGMIYGSALRSAYPRARVKAIHTEKAKEVPGVVAVFTAEDIPGSIKVGHLKQDWDGLIPVGHLTHYLGDAIALVAGENLEAVEEGKRQIEVEYEELPIVRNPYEAMVEDAPKVHEEEKDNLLSHWHVHRGDAEAAIRNSAHVISDTFHTPWTEHAFLEPECAVAVPDGDGVIIYSSDQGVYDTQHECMALLGLPAEKVKVRNKLVGGGFGGKEDVTVQHHAAMIAYLTKRPVKVKLTRAESILIHPKRVKVKLTRAESILIHPKRHPMDMEFTLGCDENGIIQGVKATVIADTGAYASLGGPVLQRACTHASGPYNYQNFDIDGKAYYTNNPPAGAFRGFGVTQTCFAIEMLKCFSQKWQGVWGFPLGK